MERTARDGQGRPFMTTFTTNPTSPPVTLASIKESLAKFTAAPRYDCVVVTDEIFKQLQMEFAGPALARSLVFGLPIYSRPSRPEAYALCALLIAEGRAPFLYS